MGPVLLSFSTGIFNFAVRLTERCDHQVFNLNGAN